MLKQIYKKVDTLLYSSVKENSTKLFKEFQINNFDAFNKMCFQFLNLS